MRIKQNEKNHLKSPSSTWETCDTVRSLSVNVPIHQIEELTVLIKLSIAISSLFSEEKFSMR